MAVTILLDQEIIPTKGPVDLHIERSFVLNISAAEAQHKVHGWLRDEVSSNIGADLPVLVVDERPVWRVNAWLSSPRYGRVGTVGSIDVDVESGELCNELQSKAEIEQQACQLARQLSPYQPRRTMPAGYITDATIPPAPKLSLADEDAVAADTAIAELVTAAAD